MNRKQAGAVPPNAHASHTLCARCASRWGDHTGALCPDDDPDSDHVRFFVPEAPMAERLREMTDAAHRAPALARQEGGGHYKAMAIQPFTYALESGRVQLQVGEGATLDGLRGVRHFLDLLIEAEQTAQNRSTS